MAHDRSAPYEEAASRGVDLWAAHDVHLIFHAGDRHPMELVGQGTHYWVAPLDSSSWLVAWLPQGVEQTQARTPRLTWLPDSSAAFLVPYIERGVEALERGVSTNPADFGRRRDLGYFLFLSGSPARALPKFETALRQVGDDPEIRLYLGMCRAELGDAAAARADLVRALELAQEQEDSRLARLIESRLAPPETSSEAPPGTGAGAEGR
jgi:tetratricopeptide (TPR) repeat protein